MIDRSDLIYDIIRIVCVPYDVCGVNDQEPFTCSIIHFSRLFIVRIFRYLSTKLNSFLKMTLNIYQKLQVIQKRYSVV